MLSVGRYQLLETLGEGGMGLVYKAFDPLIGRTVAVKLISARLTESPELRQRFFSEARAAGQLSHRNIVTIFDLGEDNGHPYFAMEYLEGRNLRVRLQSFERMSLARKLEIMSCLCDGLAYAHSRGITHRDVKPANVFITDAGEVKVLDFGLARLPASELTHSKTLIGTLNYMAPEQIAGEKTDHRTDIFAVGVVFYETLSGRSPFEADSVAALLNKILRDEAQPLGALDSSIPPRLNSLVARAMAKAKEDRYQSLNELLIDLAECRALIRESDAGSGSWVDDLDVTRPVPASGPRLRSGSSGSHPQPPSSAVPTPQTPLPVAHSDAAAVPGSGTSGPTPPARTKSARWMIAAAALVAVVGLAAAAGRLGWPQRPGHQGPTSEMGTGRPVSSEAPALARPQPPGVQPAPGLRSSRAGDTDADAGTPKGTVGGAPPLPPEHPSPPPRTTAGPARDTRTASGRRDAEAAREAARAAMQGADAANASEFASATYRAAADRAETAGDLFARGLFSLAAGKSREAGDLFRRSETEALAERERRSQAVRPSAQPEAKGAEPPAAASSSPLPSTLAPPPVTPPAPVSSAAPAAPARPPAEGAIRDLLARYVDALESRDLPSLKRIWPGLSGTQERALRDEFDQAKSIAVHLDDPAIQLANGSATVVCRRRYQLVTQDGHHLESRNTSFFSLRHQASGWVIESVKHDAPR